MSCIIGRKFQHDGVHAIPFSSRRGAIIEKMSEMASASPAQHFYSVHPERFVRLIDDSPLPYGFEEAWPATGACKFRIGTEKLVAADSAIVCAEAFKVPIFPGEGSFGVFLPGYGVHIGRKYFFPGGVRDIQNRRIGA